MAGGGNILSRLSENPELTRIWSNTTPNTVGGIPTVATPAPAPTQQTIVGSPRFLTSEPITPGAPAANASQVDAAIRPFLTEGLRQAQEIFLRQQPSFFPGQTYISPSQQTLQALQAQENIARSSSPTLDLAQGAFLRGMTAPSAAVPLYQNIYGAAGTQPGVDIYRQAAQGGMNVAGQSEIANLYGQAGQIQAPSAVSQVASGALGVGGGADLAALQQRAGQVGVPSALTQAAEGQLPISGQGQISNLYAQAGQIGAPSIYGQVAGGGVTNPAQAQLQGLLGQAGIQPGSNVYQQAAMGGMPVAGQAQLQNLYGAAGAQPGQNVFGAAAGGQFQNIATGQLANIAGGGFLQGNPFQSAMMEAATRPLVQQFSETVLPGISSLYSRSGRLGSGSMERALERSTEAFGRSIGDITAGLAGTQFQQERALQQQALGQLAGVSAQDIQTRLAGAGALEQAQRATVGQQAGIAGQLAGLSAQDIQTRLAGAGALEQAQRAATAQQAGIAGQIGGFAQQDLANRLAAAGAMEASQRAGIAQQAGLAGQLAGLSQQDIATRLSSAQAVQEAQRAGIAQEAGLATQRSALSQQDIANRLAASQALEASQRTGISQQAGLAGQLAGLSGQDVQTRLLGAQGLQQAQQAALSTQLQAAGGVGTGQYQELTRQLGAAAAAPQIYGQQFLPSQTLAQVGAQREAIAAQPLQEQMARFAFQQRLPYEQLSGYLSSVYGSPLGSYGTPAAQPQFAGNQAVGALGGALAGGLGGYALGQAFPSLSFGGGFGLPALGAIGGGLLGGGFF